MNTTPLQRYQDELQQSGFVYDAAQEQAVQHLQRVYDEISEGKLIRKKKPSPRGKQASVIQGLYIWGGVGRGKTYLMDVFFDCLPIKRKRRFHFHVFMHMVHDELKSVKNKENPLSLVVNKLSRNARIICLDEFFVSDIGDAMILAGLLNALFHNGIPLVMTSNAQPDELYPNGLQRDRFIPAIDLIKQHTEVYYMEGETDYRLNFLEKAEIYHIPLDQNANKILQQCFSGVAPDLGLKHMKLTIDGRELPTVYTADGAVWFEFEEICGGPRSQNDYIEIARCFNTVLISNVTIMKADHEDKARRWISLVDVFYDHNVKLIVSAEAPAEQLYQGSLLQPAYQRTASRLHEMQSHDYLARPHMP